MTQNITARFPIIPTTKLIYGSKCGICRETYGAEDAVRLPCGHEFGSICISTWLSPKGHKNTCPLCRSELFPVTVPQIDEELVLLQSTDTQDWDTVATETDSLLRAEEPVHRSSSFRDWLLYSQLEGQGAYLPPWRPSSTDPGPCLDSVHEEALFRELSRRGAFRALPVPVGLLVHERQIWDFLRQNGYSYDPIYAVTAGGCAWSQS